MNSLTRSLPRLARPSPLKQFSPRTFTTFTPLRPTLFSSPPGLAFRRTSPAFTPTTLAATASEAATAESSAVAADLIPRSSISTHPSFLGASQIRCGPRKLKMNGHTRLVQKRRNGFLNRLRSRDGRNTLMRRRMKGRKDIAH